MYSIQEFSNQRETIKPNSDGEGIIYFPLKGLLLTDRVLVLNSQIRMLSLLAEGPLLVQQQQLTENEMRVLVPLLESFPSYCPYDLLLASMFTVPVTNAALDYWRRMLNDAQVRGTWQQELKPLRRALSSLRSKLHTFSLEVSTVREVGSSLTSLRPRAI